MGNVVALGTFDGIHLGHQRIINDAVSYAQKHGCPPVVKTFDPHPQQFIVPERGLKLLTTLSERKKLIGNFHVSKIKVFKFNKNLQQLKYDKFIENILVKKLKASVVFVGYDYAFGHGRQGGISELKRLGKTNGFKVKVVKPFKISKHIVKSNAIRKLVAEGNFKKAVHFLGHPYQITGKVVKGKGIGAGLGFPTANLAVDPHKLIPRQGVYIGKVNGRKCLVNIGSRPTFGIRPTEVEVFILKFHKNLYDKTLCVELYRRLRDEIQFPDIEQLKGQIARDVAKASRIVI